MVKKDGHIRKLACQSIPQPFFQFIPCSLLRYFNFKHSNLEPFVVRACFLARLHAPFLDVHEDDEDEDDEIEEYDDIAYPPLTFWILTRPSLMSLMTLCSSSL